jgi:hypothetical protein
MKKVKITESQLKGLVKKMIKEETEKYQETENNYFIPRNNRIEFSNNEVNDINQELKMKRYVMRSFDNLIAYPQDKTRLFFVDNKTEDSSNDVSITKMQEENEYLPTYVVQIVTNRFDLESKIDKRYKVNGLAKLGMLINNLIK